MDQKGFPAVATREPEAAYRDTSIDDPEAPLLHSPASGHCASHTTPSPIIDTTLSIGKLRNAIYALSFPFTIAAAALVPQAEPGVGIYSVIIWSFLAAWTTARLFRAWCVSRRQSGAERRWSCCGLLITCERRKSGKKSDIWKWIVRGCDFFWIVLCIPATVAATTTGAFNYYGYWESRPHTENQERGLLACGSIVMILYAINIALSFLPTTPKLRLTLTQVEEEGLALPEPARQTGPISVHA